MYNVQKSVQIIIVQHDEFSQNEHNGIVPTQIKKQNITGRLGDSVA